MRHEYTPAVGYALRLATQLAQATSTPQVEPLHLFRALLSEEEGLSSATLQRCGATLDALQALVGMPGTLSAPADLPVSTALGTLLREAQQLARAMTADRIISSEHVLLAFLRCEPAPLRELESLDLARLELELLGEHAHPVRLEQPLELVDLPEQFELARVLDACGNRAREALRVLEDHTRFVLDDALLTEELKTLRHDLRRLLAAVPLDQLLQARDTSADVGTAISTESEQRRHSLEDVVQAGCKRLQEALRSLEEYGKLVGPEVGQGLEQLRYRSYILEQAIVPGAAARQRLQEVKLYALITAAQCYGALEWTIREAATGGVQAFQLREKDLPDRELLERARQVRRWTRQAGTLLLINDRPDIARLVEADGVHLGQDDLPVQAAREIMGGKALIGVSTHNLDQLRRAILAGASYVGTGPTFPSTTKDFSAFAGLQYLQEATRITSLPAFAIGGITLANLEQVLTAGARRIAISAAICASDQPQAVARALRQRLEG